MRTSTCFVMMPIGDQAYGKVKLSSTELKERYNNLIKEALLVARPDLSITRADEIAVPGTITSDILTRIMHSDIVVADVSFPNPNVFYELGLRHASRPGTIIIRDAQAPRPPFDIAHLRHIEYQNTPTGLKDLGERFSIVLDHFARLPDEPDNHFLELAKLTRYQFPNYGVVEQPMAPELEVLLAVMGSPQLMELFSAIGTGKEVDPARVFSALAAEPGIAKQVLGLLARSGHLPFPQPVKQVRAPQNSKLRKKK